MNNKNHKWTDREIEILIEAVIKEYIVKNSRISLNFFLDRILQALVFITRESLQKRIRNLKNILIDLEVVNFLDVSPLSHDSPRDRRIFLDLSKKYKMKSIYLDLFSSFGIQDISQNKGV